MRILVVGVYAASVVTFRGDMLREMAQRGHEVLAVAPEDDPEVRDALAAMGVHYQAVPMQRTSLSPFQDLRTLAWLARVIRRFRADCVLTYAAKPVVYGSLAARLMRVPHRAAMITGMGSALGGAAIDASRKRRLLATLTRELYRVALRGVHTLFFQNPDDLAAFRSLGLIPRKARTVLIGGSGVNLETFAEAPWPAGPLTFLMMGRLIRDKGVHEYVEAARRVRAVVPDVRVRLLGDLDTNPTAITAEELDAWTREGVIEYLGSTEDVRPYLADTHVYVLPSYGEGMPRSVLEALAVGRPVIVTDVPGCRETVVDGRNGRLVAVRDPGALADAMLDLAGRPDDLPEMGRRSRRMAEERFDVRIVNRTILEALDAA